MSGVKSRGKGAAGEREVKILLRSILAPVFQAAQQPLPELERNLTQSRSGGADLEGLNWLSIEVKRQEKLNLTAWWEQTLKAAGGDKIPCLVWRANHQPWRARVRAPVVITNLTGAVDLTMDLEWEAFSLWLQWEAWGRLSAP